MSTTGTYSLQKFNERSIGLTLTLCGLSQVVGYLKNWFGGLSREYRIYDQGIDPMVEPLCQ